MITLYLKILHFYCIFDQTNAALVSITRGVMPIQSDYIGEYFICLHSFK